MDDGSHGWYDAAADRNGVDADQVLCFAAVIGYTLAAWAVFKQYAWWDTAALVSGVVGLVAVVPFVVGQSQLDVGFGDLGVCRSTCGCTSWAARR